MGKKQGEAARVKGNAKPSSSAKAAEMLTKVPNYSFGTDIPSIGKGTFLEESFDSNIDPDFRMSLKKLSKKDTLTKSKTLDELKNLIDSKSQDDCISIVSYWAKSYTKLSIDYDRRIRELCQQTHEKLCAKVNKHLAPHIKTIMPYWLMAQCDSHSTAAKIADNSFKTMFNEAKQPEVIYFCRDEILNTFQDFMLVQTAKTLSDMKNTSEDEAVQKYENILSMTMRAFSLYLNYLFTFKSKVYESFNWSALEKIFFEQKFLKYSKDSNAKIRSNFFYLLSSVIDSILLNETLIEKENSEDFTFRKNLKVKFVPLIFYALDEDNEICCQFVWTSISKCLAYSDRLDSTNFWSLINVKKAFIPKLMSLLRNHGNANANSLNIETIYPCLGQLLKHLKTYFDSFEEKFLFYKEFLAKIYELVSRELSNVAKIRFANVDSTRTTVINSYFNSLSVILEDFKTQSEPNLAFSHEILNQIKKIYEAYLILPAKSTGFEQSFNKFVKNVDDFMPSETFKSNLNDLLITKLESEVNLDKQLNLLKNYLALDLKNSQILKQIFQLFLNKIEDCLPIINYLLSDFYDPQYLLLISDYEPENKSIENFLIKLFSNSSKLVQKTIFYSQISIKLNQQETLCLKLDSLIFNSDRSQESIDSFMQQLINHILNNKISQEISSLFINWIKSSQIIKKFINEFLLNNLENNSMLISELNSILKDKKFTLSVLEIIWEYLKKTSTADDKIIELNLNLLNDEFASNFQLLWNILVEYFRMRLKENLLSQSADRIVKKLIDLLIRENLLEQLIELVMVDLNCGDGLIVQIVEQIQVEIQQTRDTEFVNKFSQSVSLTDKLNFENMYLGFLNNSDLISRLYLDKKYNYLFTEVYSQLINDTKPDPEWLTRSDINKITYSISRLKISLNTNWYHLILSSILVDKFYMGTQNVSDFRNKLHSLFYESGFVDYLVENLLNSDKFIANNFQPSTLIGDLNKFSLLLMYTIDLKYDIKIHLVAQNYMGILCQYYPDEGENIRVFLMDVPFAKQSIIDNVDVLMNNIDDFYALFESVLNELVLKIENLTNALDILNKDQHLSLLEFNLQKYSFILNILSKYVQVYFDFLKEKNDTKIEFIFKNEKTIEFIRTKLSDYMNRTLNFLIKLKESVSENLDNLVNKLSLEEFGSGYFFYFNYSSEPRTSLNWEELNFSIKINYFLSLFFDQCADLSAFLTSKQWDFLLCYSSAMSQRLKKPLIENINRVYIQMASIEFFKFVDRMTEYLSFRISDCQIRTDWSEFFSKEIMDPTLIVFSNLAESSIQTNIGIILLNSLSSLMSKVNYDRVINNQLEAKFNVMDLDVSFNDKIKTIFNYFVPFLTNKIAPVQLGAYKVLKVFMLNIDNYFADENNSQIIESLPYVFKETFFQLTDLFSDLKKSFEFEQTILSNEKNLTDQTNNRIMSFLLIYKLVLDMFSSNNLQFKSKLAANLRELNFSDYLMNCLFRLMEKSGSEKFTKQDEDSTILADERQFFDNKFVELFSCRMYKQALKMCPAMIRDWWNMQPKRISDQVDKFTTKYVSPILIDEELKQINKSANDLNSEPDSDEESSIKIKGIASTREVVSTYKMKELSMDLLIQLPVNYPLGIVSVSSAKRLGVSENEWRNWLLQLTTYLTHQNGSIIQGLQIWKRNVDKKFAGVEECTICYSVIHGTNYQLPKMKCRTCKHMFHSVCLYKWFESSSKSSCPLCRNLF